jgi:hypothetical protein
MTDLQLAKLRPVYGPNYPEVKQFGHSPGANRHGNNTQLLRSEQD